MLTQVCTKFGDVTSVKDLMFDNESADREGLGGEGVELWCTLVASCVL